MMNRFKKICAIRRMLANNQVSIGSWLQIPHASVAEIMGQAGYDWVAIDLEHGSISIHQLPDLCRALELGHTLPLVRLAQGHLKDCKQALDAGAGGIIVPMIETAEQLMMVRDASRWPIAGKRGVGFSRGNLYGKHFDSYEKEAQAPLVIAMIEHIHAVNVFEDILRVDGLDAILIGPYDLSASLDRTARFEAKEFRVAMEHIRLLCQQYHVPCGIHVVMPDKTELKQRIEEGYRFIAYSIDAVFLHSSSEKPDFRSVLRTNT